MLVGLVFAVDLVVVVAVVEVAVVVVEGDSPMVKRRSKRVLLLLV